MRTKAPHPKRQTPAERQRKYRERLKQEGHRRLEVSIPPDLWARLRPLIEQEHCGQTLPGFGLVQLLRRHFSQRPKR
jgi:hypothetical protein